MRRPMIRVLARACAAAVVAAGVLTAPAIATPSGGGVGTTAVWCDWVASYAGAWVPARLEPFTVDCEMGRGAHSPAVEKLQYSMNLCYGKGLRVDSDFGGATERALKEVQRAVGAAVDGRYGPETRSKMVHQPISGSSCVRVP
ncbi:peptidoglycan hydrolase-like protein with peptidoglycan-binding domain [Kibdelosporangium banguiense]|uniref:Peptidoglycan hydrolase-like protein with peptidoglycan-binding domain n=1 Tax=Kibdelosporangium banguiense TaxID=1365924 RepID=A0ABS4TZ80_9PSEU|nr:peptidoglycan-binding domain-containing protein [Kibdelosporangium banguiense]MBP2329303.1 peptidoglycan hydrolase-like protein with peptidoglycan-binding domain [Kibdelosporangium banguiense]